MERVKSATEQTKVVLKLPSKWVSMYGDFITKNAGAVGQVEGALRSLTYLVPGEYTQAVYLSKRSDLYRRWTQDVRYIDRVPQLWRTTAFLIPR